jgi:hypothetical protein
MEEHIINLLAYCGLYCEDCIRYQDNIVESAQRLLGTLDESEFERYAAVKKKDVSSFENYQLFIDVLKDIIKLHCNRPCRVGDGCPTFNCQIIKCCKEKEYEGCWQCEQVEECDKLDFLKAMHEDFHVKNCLIMREHDLKGFLKSRYPSYTWAEKNKAQ